jgi:hypothetical protein
MFYRLTSELKNGPPRRRLAHFPEKYRNSSRPKKPLIEPQDELECVGHVEE